MISAILRIGISGYRLLKDGFEINFLSRSKVPSETLSSEVLQIDKSLYTFRTIGLVGRNASGKSTVLELIKKAHTYLETGRLLCLNSDFHKDEIKLSIDFYLDGFVYFYDVVFTQNDPSPMLLSFCLIKKERLKRIKYRSAKGKKILELKDDAEDVSYEFLSRSLPDSSAIVTLTKGHFPVDEFTDNNFITADQFLLRGTFFQSLTRCKPSFSIALLRLLDDSIEELKILPNGWVSFKRFNEAKVKIRSDNLIPLLSKGTFRGLELFVRAMAALKKGGTLIVDEIEDSLNKSLVDNLFFFFNDASRNKKGAKLIFSTHYFEVLDILNRQDSIFITHKNEGKIDVKNMGGDYDVRTELLKSKALYNDTFDTNLNYQLLMNLVEEMDNELLVDNN